MLEMCSSVFIYYPHYIPNNNERPTQEHHIIRKALIILLHFKELK